jgi:hypothetical protein
MSRNNSIGPSPYAYKSIGFDDETIKRLAEELASKHSDQLRGNTGPMGMNGQDNVNKDKLKDLQDLICHLQNRVIALEHKVK